MGRITLDRCPEYGMMASPALDRRACDEEHRLALFGKKNQNANEDDGEDQGFVPRPEKAQRWVSQAKQIADTGNYTYALTCYASAVKLDPTDLNTHKLMFEAAVGQFTSGGKAASRKELKDVDGPHPSDKVAVAELAWMRDVNNYALAMKLLDAAVKAELEEFSAWLAPKNLNMLKKAKKQSKSDYVKARNLFAEASAWTKRSRRRQARPQRQQPGAGTQAAHRSARDHLRRLREGRQREGCVPLRGQGHRRAAASRGRGLGHRGVRGRSCAGIRP